MQGLLGAIGLGPGLEADLEAKIGFGLAHSRVNSTWIKSGKIGGDEDPLPWLRTVQLHGLELVIIGSTVDAVKVCVEAFAAGFKPVLIVMEDQVQDEAVGQMLAKLSHSCWSRYPFRNGPVLINADSESCMVRLDESGHAVDTYVRTNIGGILSNSEAWQYFKGPVIVVDSFMHDESRPPKMMDPTRFGPHLSLAVKMEQDESARASTKGSHRHTRTIAHGELVREMSERLGSMGYPTDDSLNLRKRFHASLQADREKVTDPKFWQARFDPERFGYRMVTYTQIFLYSFIATFVMLCFCLEGGVVGTDWYIPVRLVNNLILMTPAWASWAIVYSGCLGFIARNWPNQLNFKVMLVTVVIYLIMFAIKVGKYYFSVFTNFTVGIVLTTASSIGFTMCLGEIKVSKWNILWSLAVISTMYLGFVLSLILALCYLALMNIGGTLAAGLLSPAYAILEYCLSQGIATAYDRLIWRQRQIDPDSVAGEHRSYLSVALAAVLGCCDVGKFSALICGQVRLNKIYYSSYAILSLMVGFAINVIIRSGWLFCTLSKLVPQKRSWWCPRSPTCYTQDCKYIIWLTQFLMFAGVVFARGIVTQNMTIPALESYEMDNWLWSSMVAIVFALSIIVKLAEDSAVLYFNSKHPAPIWECFGEQMQLRIDKKDSKMDPCHLHHYLSQFRSVDVSIQGNLAEGELETQSGRRSKKPVRLSSDLTSDLVPRILASPNFKHTREFKHFQMLVVVSLQWTLFYVVFTTGLGLGNFNGRCWRINMDDTADLVRRLFLITDDCHS